jgi:hypothetical protein
MPWLFRERSRHTLLVVRMGSAIWVFACCVSALIPASFGYALLKDWDATKPDWRDFGNSEAPESNTRRHDRHHGKT